MMRDDTGFAPLSDAWIINVANEIHRAMPDNAEEVDEMLQIARAVEQAAYAAAIKACREQIYGDAMRIEGVSNCIDAIRSLKERPK